MVDQMPTLNTMGGPTSRYIRHYGWTYKVQTHHNFGDHTGLNGLNICMCRVCEWAHELCAGTNMNGPTIMIVECIWIGPYAGTCESYEWAYCSAVVTVKHGPIHCHL
jgi:hypothetical protein